MSAPVVLSRYSHAQQQVFRQMFWHVPFTQPWPDGQQVLPHVVVSVGHTHAPFTSVFGLGHSHWHVCWFTVPPWQAMVVGHTHAQVVGFCTFGEVQVVGHSHAQVLWLTTFGDAQRLAGHSHAQLLGLRWVFGGVHTARH